MKKWKKKKKKKRGCRRPETWKVRGVKRGERKNGVRENSFWIWNKPEFNRIHSDWNLYFFFSFLSLSNIFVELILTFTFWTWNKPDFNRIHNWSLFWWHHLMDLLLILLNWDLFNPKSKYAYQIDKFIYWKVKMTKKKDKCKRWKMRLMRIIIN